MDKKERKKQPNGNLAVSSIVGTVLLLLIAVSSFTFIYLNVLSDQGPAAKIYVDIVGTVEGKNVILEHRGGESLNLETEIRVTIGGEEQRIIVGDNLDYADSANGQWDLGERVIIPFDYDIDDLDEYMEADVMAFEGITNSLAFMGKIELHPYSDIGIEISVEPDTPVIESDVTIIVTASCLSGDVGAVNIEIQCLLPQGLIHVSNTSTRGDYVNSTGLWSIPKLDIWETATLTIEATVTTVEEREFTQIAMILDGSASILSPEWELMRTGLANAIEDSSIFPHDGSVELTVIQFGVGVSHNLCRVEISPTIVEDTNFQSIANTVRSLSQGRGGTPMAAGIYLTSDTLENSIHFDQNNRQIINLVTDGEPTYYSNEGEYIGHGTGGDVDPIDKQTTVSARDYLLANLKMTEDQDEFDALAVGGGPDVDWLNSSIVWPPPGYIWDDSIDATPPGPGWVSQIGSWAEFQNAINEIFNIMFNTIKTSVEITKLQPSDPNTANDRISASIVPQDE